jgi:cytochrome c-type biogenesis protein CcmF
VGLIMAFSQFLKYKRTKNSEFVKSTLASLVVALVVTAGVVYVTKVYTEFMYMLITFSAVFALIANGRILAEAFRGKWKLAGSSVAHIGFALLLIGALVAAATNEVISKNSSNYIAVAGFDQVEKPGDNLFLTEGEPVQMGEYTVTYVGDSVAPPNVYYKINYERIDEETGKVKESFQLRPFAQNNPAMGGLIGTPATKHYLTHDIYTLITAAMSDSFAKTRTAENADEPDGYEQFEEPAVYEVNIGDTVRYRNGFIVVTGVNRDAKIENISRQGDDLIVGLQVKVHSSEGKEFESEPLFMIRGGNSFDFAKDVPEQGLRFRFSNILPSKDKLELMVYQKPLPEKKWIVFKAIKFPYINFFWAGTIVMTIGFLMSIFRRNREIKGKV